MPNRRHLSSLRISGILVLLLGLGNIVVGQLKGEYYHNAVVAAQRDALDQKQPLDSLGIQRLESRKGFYEIVTLGGVGFILAGVTLFGLDTYRRQVKSQR
jgi:hypothetical protein